MASDLTLPVADLDRAASTPGADAWSALEGGRVLLTGGTGFVGTWLLASALQAVRKSGLATELVVLSRDPARFAAAHPGVASAPEVTLVAGDVRGFDLPPGPLTHVVHAAADVAVGRPPRETFDVLAAGTRQVLDVAADRGAIDLLLVSSGAVYGAQPPTLEAIPETYPGAPSPAAASSAYGEGKRVSEWLTHRAGDDGLAVRVARCFAFVGPLLPLDGHFAVGNFMRDALAGRTLEVQGDGTALRTYLHAADLAGWLWTLLLRGPAGSTYNVGGAEALSIADLARRVAGIVGSTAGVRVAGRAEPGALPARYVPDVSAARRDLVSVEPLGLDEALARTAAWHRERT